MDDVSCRAARPDSYSFSSPVLVVTSAWGRVRKSSILTSAPTFVDCYCATGNGLLMPTKPQPLLSNKTDIQPFVSAALLLQYQRQQ